MGTKAMTVEAAYSLLVRRGVFQFTVVPEDLQELYLDARDHCTGFPSVPDLTIDPDLAGPWEGLELAFGDDVDERPMKLIAKVIGDYCPSKPTTLYGAIRARYVEMPKLRRVYGPGSSRESQDPNAPPDVLYWEKGGAIGDTFALMSHSEDPPDDEGQLWLFVRRPLDWVKPE